MNEVLDPLVRIAGVRKALLVSDDGVAIASRDAESPAGAEAADRCEGPQDLDALAGLSAGWVGDIRRAVDPLAWDPPEHVVLRAAHGTLIAMRAPGSLLMVILERGAQPEDLRVPMGAAVARVQRVLRRPGPGVEPPGIFPSKATSPTAGEDESELTENEVPEVSGER